MDTFLQLGGDPNLVYDELVVGDLETQIQRHIAESSQAEGLFGEQLYRPVGGEDESGRDDYESDEMERHRYLQRILSIEKDMREANNAVQQRIDAMSRILELTDPTEQLAEYLALKQEARRQEDVDIVQDLLHCAKRMTNTEDSEAAMLGGFFFLCDRQRPKTRGLTAMLPVVAAMMDTPDEPHYSPF